MGLSRCKLNNKEQLDLVRFFVTQTTARTAADLASLHRNTVALFYHKLPLLIADKMMYEEPFDGEIELDESYFSGVSKGTDHPKTNSQSLILD